jgi:hypothetical protein
MIDLVLNCGRQSLCPVYLLWGQLFGNEVSVLC